MKHKLESRLSGEILITSDMQIINLYAEYIMRNTGLEETQTGIKIAGRNINNLRYADDTTHGRKQRGAKDPLDESERGE